MSSDYPHLSPTIEVLAGTDVDDVWDRFEIFEALHHSMQICNPMDSSELNEVIEAFGLSGGEHVYDAACGFGELLIRCAEKTAIAGTGVDLSPWMVTGAVDEAERRVPNADLRWELGEARDYLPEPRPDVAVCIGAEWVWHDFTGTARALSQQVAPGGVVAIAAARLRHGADQAAVTANHGTVETVDDMAATLQRFGLVPVHRVDPTDDGWDGYLARTAVAVEQWRQLYPGDRAERWASEQRDWQAARDRDRHITGWSVWVAHKARASA